MVKIARRDNRLVIEKDNKVIFPYAYISYLEKQAKFDQFAEAGFDLYSVCTYAHTCMVNEVTGTGYFNKGLWDDKNHIDFSPLDESINNVLKHKSDASIILRINLNAPKWWREENKDELWTTTDGSTFMQSAASLKWREFAKELISKIHNHIQTSGYKDNVIAYQLAGLNTEEWLAVRSENGFFDVSSSFRNYYANYLQQKYLSIDKLNAIWGTSYSSFEEVELPTSEEFYNAQKINVYDDSLIGLQEYLRAFNKAVGDTIIDLTRFTKSLVNDDVLIGTFYGYIGQIPGYCGHNDVWEVINEDSIDFFASPVAYNHARQGAYDFFYHSVVDSVRKLNKLWFFENDIRTCLSKPLCDTNPECAPFEKTINALRGDVWKGPSTLEESKSVLIRSLSKTLISDDAFWWFDMWGGFYNNPEMMEIIKKGKELQINEPSNKNNQVAVILDENSTYEISDRYHYEIIYQQLSELGYIGCSYDIYHVNDINDELKSKYIAIVFLAPSSETRKRHNLNGGYGNYVVTSKQVLFSDSLIKIDELRKALEPAGVHLYSFGNIVYNSSNYLCITAKENGNVEIKLPDDEKLVSVFDETVVEGSILNIELQSNENKLFKREKKNRYYIGVDGGGTKTKFVLKDKGFNFIKEIVVRCSNPNKIGVENSIKLLKDGINAITPVDATEINVSIGLSGLAYSGAKERIIGELRTIKNINQVYLESDIRTVLDIAYPNTDGAIAIIGTGVVGYSRKNGSYKMIAGLGYKKDNLLSGYDLGHYALFAVLEDLKGTGTKTKLTELITKISPEISKTTNIDEYEKEHNVACFAPYVFEAKDNVSEDILKNCVGRFETLLREISRDFREITLFGGLTKQWLILQNYLSVSIKNKIDIKVSASDPVEGAFVRFK